MAALTNKLLHLLYIKILNFNLLAYSSIEACERAVYYCINYTQSPCHTKMYLLQHAVSRCRDFCHLSVLSAQLRRRDPRLPRGLWVRKAPWFCILQNATTIKQRDVRSCPLFAALVDIIKEIYFIFKTRVFMDGNS